MNFCIRLIVKSNMEYLDYAEWRRKYLFEDMNDEELQADILRYAKTRVVGKLISTSF